MGSHWLNVLRVPARRRAPVASLAAQAFAGTDTLIAYAYCAPPTGKLKARSASVAMPTTAGGSTVVQAMLPQAAPRPSPAASRPRPPNGHGLEPRLALDRRRRQRGGSWMGPGSAAPPPARLSPTSTAPKSKVKTRFEDAAVVRARSAAPGTAATPRLPEEDRGRRGRASRPAAPSAVCSTPPSSTRRSEPAAGWTSAATPSSGYDLDHAGHQRLLPVAGDQDRSPLTFGAFLPHRDGKAPTAAPQSSSYATIVRARGSMLAWSSAKSPM